MKELNLEEELDRSKFFLVKNAIVINMTVVSTLALVLYILEIKGESILKLFLKYYLN